MSFDSDVPLEIPSGFEHTPDPIKTEYTGDLKRLIAEEIVANRDALGIVPWSEDGKILVGRDKGGHPIYAKPMTDAQIEALVSHTVSRCIGELLDFNHEAYADRISNEQTINPTEHKE